MDLSEFLDMVLQRNYIFQKYSVAYQLSDIHQLVLFAVQF